MSQEASVVLLIEDQVGDLFWIIDLVQARGYQVEAARNEEDARMALAQVAANPGRYALVLIDVMMATIDINRVLREPNLDPKALEPSPEAGIRLAQYLREELRVTPQQVAVICCTAKHEDAKVRRIMEELDIPVYDRYARAQESSLRTWLKTNLADRR